MAELYERMKIEEQLFAALGQVIVIFGLGLLVYISVWLFSRRRLDGQSLFRYLGIVPTKGQLDRRFWIAWLGLVIFAILSLFLEFHFSESMRKMLMSDSSPYGKILKSGFSSAAILKALIYCFIQASYSEELLFRGLIAKRLYNSIGFRTGNFIQALIFWLMHLIIVRLFTGEWFSAIQLMAFLTSFGLGLILGWANFRKNGESLAPSWILHGSANFFSFLSLAYVWPR